MLEYHNIYYIKNGFSNFPCLPTTNVLTMRITASYFPMCAANSATARASPPAIRVPNPLFSPLLKVAPV
jgi:hypothetical protein